MEGRVWIKPVKCGNSGIYQIHLTNRFIDNQDFEYDYKKIVAGTFSLSQAGVIEGEKPPTPQMRTALEPDYPILTATWKGGWTFYGGVEVKEKVTKFKISAATGGGYKGNIFEVHLGSSDGEVIARATPVPKSWKFVTVETELLRPLEPGTYDLYLTFDGGNKSCSDVHWFGFE